MQRPRWFVLLAGFATLVAVPAADSSAAEIGFFGWGLRGGISSDPDQAVVGVHFDLGEFADRVLFRPNADFGFGDDETVITANAAVHWLPAQTWDKWQPYVGGEIGLNHRDIDRDHGRDKNETDLALNAVGGVDRVRPGGAKLSFEIKIGLAEEPDLKLLVGWTF